MTGRDSVDLTDIAPKLGNNPEVASLANWIEESGLLVKLHDRNTIRINGTPGVSAQFVSCFAVVDRDVDTVRETVRDFSNYESMLEEINSSVAREISEGATRADFTLEIDTPVLSPSFDYTLEYQSTDDGDVVFHDIEGDFNHVIGRWEFVDVGEKTLLIYTVWNDYSDLGLTFRTIFWAQPDLKIAMPMTQASVLTEQIRARLNAEDRSVPAVDDLPEAPEAPSPTGANLPTSALVDLSETGTLMYVHPRHWIRDGERPLDLRFVSGIGVMDAPLERTQDLTTRFERYPDYVNMVSNVDSREVTDGYEATWTLDLGVKIASLSFSYSLRYTWEHDTRLVFHRTGGDLQHVYGSLEWEPVDDSRTLFFYTPATQIGQDDSLMVRVAEGLPHRQIVIGVSAGALTVKSQAKWIRDRQEKRT